MRNLIELKNWDLSSDVTVSSFHLIGAVKKGQQGVYWQGFNVEVDTSIWAALKANRETFH